MVSLRCLILTGLTVIAVHGIALGQSSRLVDGRYEPLDQRVPPGVASHWQAAIRRITPGYQQPVRVELPDEKGQVLVYSGPNGAATKLGMPAQTSLTVGHVYRFRVSDVPGFPGGAVYPTVELIGHLHPPAGLKDDFPVRVVLTAEEIELALAGRMITKVVYLENPRTASDVAGDDEVRVDEVSPRANVLHEADRLGRPVAIVRLGGRIPIERATRQFLGTPPPVVASQPTPRDEPLPAALERPSR